MGVDLSIQERGFGMRTMSILDASQRPEVSKQARATVITLTQ